MADQFALGYFRNFGKNLNWETSVEGYYKALQNQIGLTLNDYYEGDLYSGTGRAYGSEFFLRRNEGKLTGWISLTISKTEILVDSINNGEYYKTRFDKPVVGNVV